MFAIEQAGVLGVVPVVRFQPVLTGGVSTLNIDGDLLVKLFLFTAFIKKRKNAFLIVQTRLRI